MKVENARKAFRTSNTYLRKLRYHYVRRFLKDFLKDPSLIWSSAKKLQSRGVYAPTTMERDVRFYILRNMNKIEAPQVSWWDWLDARGFKGTGWWQSECPFNWRIERCTTFT